MEQSAEVTSLIELLIDADPDSLLEKHADLLTPDQLWRASGESMSDMIKFANGRKEILDYAMEKEPYEFLQEFEGEWEPAALERMVEESPGDCLEWIHDKLSPAQLEKCIEADLVAAANIVKDKLTPTQIQRLIKEKPETALSCLPEKLDDETFHRLAHQFPETAWYTSPHRVDLKFIEKYVLDPVEQIARARKLSQAQVEMVLAAHPELQWESSLKVFQKAPPSENACPKNPSRKWLVWAVGLTGIGVGIAIGIALAVPQ